MTTEQFSLKEFETALPVHKTTGQPLWKSVGLVDGEYCYLMPIRPKVNIIIRSSVDRSGFAASTGKDSIRGWLVDDEGKPLGSKVHKWTNRVPGWADRFKEVLRTLWGWGQYIKDCPDCRQPQGIYKVKKDGPNKGRIFTKCSRCGQHFQWMD